MNLGRIFRICAWAGIFVVILAVIMPRFVQQDATPATSTEDEVPSACLEEDLLSPDSGSTNVTSDPGGGIIATIDSPQEEQTLASFDNQSTSPDTGPAADNQQGDQGSDNSQSTSTDTDSASDNQPVDEDPANPGDSQPASPDTGETPQVITWLEIITTQADFLAGITPMEIDTTTSAGDVRLATRANWYDRNWLYRRAVIITNDSGSAQSDYQVNVLVNTSELITASKMQADGDDLRFTLSDGTTAVNYWIESGMNTASTSIWVKVPALPTGTCTVLVYYGNTNALSVSSLSGTFNSGSFTDSFANTSALSGYNNVTMSGGQIGLSTYTQTIFSDGFEGDLSKWDGNGNTNWYRTTNDKYTGSYSLEADNFNKGYLTSDNIDLSNATAATLDFWFKKDGTEANDLVLYFYNGASYDLIAELGAQGGNNTWEHWTNTINLNTYRIPNFRVRFYANPEDTWFFLVPLEFEHVWVDSVAVSKTTYPASGNVTSVTLPTDNGTRIVTGNQLSWNDSEPGTSDLRYHLYYYDTAWQLIPDAVLPGNSSGFDASPVDISSVRGIYSQIRLAADFSTTNTSVTPVLQDWTVTYYWRKYAPAVNGGASSTEDWLHYSTGVITSKVFDTGIEGAKWTSISWDATLTSGTNISFEVRASNQSFVADDASLSWTPLGSMSPVTSGLPSGRYQQWRAILTTSSAAETPVLSEVRTASTS